MRAAERSLRTLWRCGKCDRKTKGNFRIPPPAPARRVRGTWDEEGRHLLIFITEAGWHRCPTNPIICIFGYMPDEGMKQCKQCLSS